VESGSDKQGIERTLILCVDRDDDLGAKTGLKTPILGRDEVKKAATELILKDPEEADANAMFEAVRIYDRLREETEKLQIATIAGSELGSVEADRKLSSELTSILAEYPAGGVILVTDGFMDEAILPVVESRVPVTSVRRVVIKHSRSIETTAAIFSRYLKTIVQNPRYSRIVLGLPGILFVVLAILSLYPGGLAYVGAAFLIIVGAFLFLKGFGFDEKIQTFYRSIRGHTPLSISKLIMMFSGVAGVLLVAVGCYTAWTFIASSSLLQPLPVNLGQWFSLLPTLIGVFALNSVTLIVIGVCVLLSGSVVHWLMEHNPRFWRSVIVVVMCIWSHQLIHETAIILINPGAPYHGLVFTIVIGIFIALVSVIIVSLLRKRYTYFFDHKVEIVGKQKEA
jgi:putative membrane protein